MASAWALSVLVWLWAQWEGAVSALGSGRLLSGVFGGAVSLAARPLANHLLAGLALRAALRQHGAPAALSAWRVAVAQALLGFGAAWSVAAVSGVRVAWLGPRGLLPSTAS